MAVSSTTVGFENHQNLKLIFERMHKSERKKRHLCLQNYTHKIVHSSAMHYQNLKSKKLLTMKNSKSLFERLVHTYYEVFKKLCYF